MHALNRSGNNYLYLFVAALFLVLVMWALAMQGQNEAWPCTLCGKPPQTCDSCSKDVGKPTTHQPDPTKPGYRPMPTGQDPRTGRPTDGAPEVETPSPQ
jgi:hypothetical protein